MSSLNINTISNKPHFKNYFSDPLTFPKNAMISLPKTNLQVPVLVAPRVHIVGRNICSTCIFCRSQCPSYRYNKYRSRLFWSFHRFIIGR